MSEIFLAVLNMSITASYVAVAVMVIRLLFKKAPKVFSYALWLVVFIRLICPFSFNSAFSIFNLLSPDVQAATGTMSYVPDNIGLKPSPAVDAGLDSINHAVNSSLPPAAITASINPMQTVTEAASLIWAAGMLLLLIYSIVSYRKVIKHVKTATLVKDNIWETDRINTPFLGGFIKPKIFVPAGLGENELSCIVTHEQVHIERLDYLIKPLAFLALIIHWFNPLIWLSYALMSKDMEMSCDESVIRKMGSQVKGSYSQSLLSLSLKRSGLIPGSPLAFGESNIKSRIKNILNYQKPALLVSILAIAATVAVMGGCISNPISDKVSANTYSGYPIDVLLKNRTPYVGNNSKVVALVDAMPVPAGIVRATVELQVASPPYGITIYYTLNDSSGLKKPGVVDKAFYRNSIILFSLIDNVEVINCKIADKNGQTIYDLSYSRKAADKLIGENTRGLASSAAKLKNLIERTNKTRFGSYTAVADVNNSQIEGYLNTIMSSPASSSNPGDYIRAHRGEYESILKMGDPALNYLLEQFARGGNNDLRGHIMMALCKDLLGPRNNVTDAGMLPQEWYDRLAPYQEIKLPDFKAQVSDPVEQLVYDTMVKRYSRPNDGFTVVAPTIFGKYEEGDRLKVFATVYISTYRLYHKTLSETSGSIVPAAITFIKDKTGNYTLLEYKEARDGSYFGPSIKEFCTMPVSGRVLPAIYSRIMQDYGNNQDRQILMIKNLGEHLQAYNQEGVVLKGTDNELIVSFPEYVPKQVQ